MYTTKIDNYSYSEHATLACTFKLLIFSISSTRECFQQYSKINLVFGNSIGRSDLE